MAATKEVQIIARYTNKITGVVNYLVRSSDGKSEYCTTIIEGKASGCSCPAHSRCYHKTQLEAKESARWSQYRSELAKKLAAQFVSTQIVEQIAEQLVAPKVAKVAKVIEQAVTAKVPTPKTDISTKGNLNGSRAFSIMR